MTPQQAIAYASEILEKHQQMNTGYTANAELARHAVTASYLMEFATRLEQLARIATPALPDAAHGRNDLGPTPGRRQPRTEKGQGERKA